MQRSPANRALAVLLARQARARPGAVTAPGVAQARGAAAPMDRELHDERARTPSSAGDKRQISEIALTSETGVVRAPLRRVPRAGSAGKRTSRGRILARDAILIAYPDFRPEIPGLGRPFALGHAGVLLINSQTGLTKYYEYGRYDPQELGLVRRQTVPNVVIRDGQPTEASLQAVLRHLSTVSGHRGRIVGAYAQSDQFAEMNLAAEARLRQNSDPNRTPYTVYGNNCATFAAEILNTDPNVERPWFVIDPSPNNYVNEYIEEGHARVDFTPAAPRRVPTPAGAR